jgi:N6-L-threonylcarbamoyladenine synthase
MQQAIEQRRRALAEMKPAKADDVLKLCDRQTLDLVASFQRAMVGDLIGKTLHAARELDVATLFITGGVAANSELRSTVEREAAMAGLPVYFPSRPLSTDNAAMIAAAAYPKLLARDFAGLELSAEASLPLR